MTKRQPIGRLCECECECIRFARHAPKCVTLLDVKLSELAAKTTTNGLKKDS